MIRSQLSPIRSKGGLESKFSKSPNHISCNNTGCKASASFCTSKASNILRKSSSTSSASTSTAAFSKRIIPYQRIPGQPYIQRIIQTVRWICGNNKHILITIDEKSLGIFWIACFSPLMHKIMTYKFKIKPCMCWQANIESFLNGIMNDFGQESTLKSPCTVPFHSQVWIFSLTSFLATSL